MKRQYRNKAFKFNQDIDKSYRWLFGSTNPAGCSVCGDPRETGEVVLKLMSKGNITPDQANTILGALNAQCRIIEIADIECRLEFLGQCNKTQDQQ